MNSRSAWQLKLVIPVVGALLLAACGSSGAGGGAGGGSAGGSGGGAAGGSGGGTAGGSGGGTAGGSGGGTAGGSGGGTAGGSGGGTAGGSGGGTAGGAGGGTAGGSGGGTAGGSGGGTAGGAGGGTAGGAGGGAGIMADGGTAQVITLTFPATCAAFTACGGPTLGNYFYTAGCLDDAEFQPLIDSANKLCGAGSTTVSNKAGTIQGGLTFSATQVARVVSGSLSFNLNLGGGCGNATACSFAAGGLAQYGVSGTCAFNTTSMKCVCAVNKSWVGSAGDNYATRDAGQLTTSGSTPKVYDYCLTNGNANLGHHEVTPSDGGTYIRDFGYFSLTK